MPSFSEIMKQPITVSSPDKLIEARLSDGKTIKARFVGADVYRRYSQNQLEDQIGQLCKLLWVARRKHEAKALTEGIGEGVRFAGESSDPARRKFFQRRDRLEFEGWSPRQMVRIECKGWLEWNVTIADGLQEYLEEKEFLAETIAAAQALIADYDEQLEELHQEFHEYRDRKIREGIPA
ncbi:MAG TPA: hypothetical protein H9902_13090 [Candidatus Stackebrandtia faecavium]|nr:hypothetical protein [Candidatus Stackebrandtia faecavium]